MDGISVVIRTFNSAATLPAVLARLPRGREDELIVVDSGSTDATPAIARAAGAVLVELPSHEFTYGRSLNRGFAVARNPWILALSSHCVARPDDLLGVYRRAIPRLRTTVAAAVGPVLYSDLDWVQTAGITRYAAADFEGGFGFGAGNPNCLYRQDLWREQPFNELTEASEDLEWYLGALNKGWELAAVHAAAVDYRSRGGFAHFFRKGRIDYRVGGRIIRLPRPKVSVAVSHSLKLVLHAMLGKISFAAFTASFSHYLGTYYESRRPRPGPPSVPTQRTVSSG